VPNGSDWERKATLLCVFLRGGFRDAAAKGSSSGAAVPAVGQATCRLAGIDEVGATETASAQTGRQHL
jgi:hypothetical protein